MLNSQATTTLPLPDNDSSLHSRFPTTTLLMSKTDLAGNNNFKLSWEGRVVMYCVQSGLEPDISLSKMNYVYRPDRELMSDRVHKIICAKASTGS